MNESHFAAMSPALSFNTAVSFVTNTDWQSADPETEVSLFVKIFGMMIQNFLSPATGLSLAMAFIRGLKNKEEPKLGNYWVDMIRGIFYILLPLSFILALILSSQGVIQSFKRDVQITPYSSVITAQPITQKLQMGPVASFVAIKQIGSNGGGYFNANAAHPFENPNPLTNFLQALAILLLPASLYFAFGKLMQNPKQGKAFFIAVLIIFIPMTFLSVYTEQKGNPNFHAMAIDNMPKDHVYPAGNMEGKETRNGIVSSALWGTATTTTASGSVNSMLDSYMPLSVFCMLS